MPNFLLHPVHSLLSRKGRAGGLALAMLLWAGCGLMDRTRKVLVSDKGKFWWVLYTKDAHGDIVNVRGPFDENGKQVPTDPFPTLQHIVPPDHPAYDKGADVLPADPFSPYQIESPLPTGLPASMALTDVSPFTTLFGLSESGAFLQMDMELGLAVRSLSLGDDLRDAVVGPLNRVAYLVSYGGLISPTPAYSLKVIDITSFLLAATIPMPVGIVPLRLDLTPDGKFAYVTGALGTASDFRPRVVVIDTAARAVVKTIILPGEWVRESVVKISPDGAQAFVIVSNGVAVINTASQEFSHVINTGSTPSHLAIDHRGTRLYVAQNFGPFVANPKPPPQLTQLNGVGIYDISTAAQVNHLPIADFQPALIAMALSDDGNFLAVSHLITDPVTLRNGAPILKIIDVITGQVIHSELAPDAIVKGLQLVPIAGR